MNRPSPSDLLDRLQTQLQHFDRCPDFGDAEAVAVIRQHLLLRIREAEGLMRCPVVVKAGKVSRSEAA